MTREQAERRAAALSAQGSRHRWFARNGQDGWEVVKVALPPGVRIDPVKETVPHATQPDAPPARRPRTTGTSTAPVGRRSVSKRQPQLLKVRDITR